MNIFSIFGKLKTYALIGLSIAIGILAAMFEHEKLKVVHNQLKEQVKAREQVTNALQVTNAVDDMSDDTVADELHKFDRD